MWYEPDDGSIDLDIGMVRKFAKVKITAPMTLEDIPNVAKDLEELKEAF
jgi:hypothetical protein